jgi:hypothetical protein
VQIKVTQTSTVTTSDSLSLFERYLLKYIS